MNEYKILKIDIENMRFVNHSEQVQVPLTLQKGGVVKDEFATIVFDGTNRKFNISSQNRITISGKAELLDIFRNDSRFEKERSVIGEFIRELSIEQPIPEFEIIEQSIDGFGNIIINLKGKGLGIDSTVPSMVFHPSLPKSRYSYTWYGLNCTYLGFTRKLHDVIGEYLKLYLLMKRGV